MRKLAAVCFSFSAAVVACSYLFQGRSRLIACAVCLLAFVTAFFGLTDRGRLLCCLVSVGMAAGFLWTQVYDAVFFQPAREMDNQTIRLSAVVTDYPRERDYGWQISARMETSDGKHLNILLYTDEQGENLRPGDQIESVTHCTLGTLSAAGEEITYYTAKGIFLWGTCYGTLSVQRPENIPVKFWSAHLAYMLKAGIDGVFPEETAGIVRAVVTGSRDKLTDKFTSSLERTGLSHTVAVSGMHLSCFAAILVFLLGRGRQSTALVVIFWSLLFCGIAGNTPSVSRAAVMIILLQIAPLLRRERDDMTALGFALMLLLIWNPYSAAHIGLQLSFAAVAGIFLLAGPMQRTLMERLGLLTETASLVGRWIQNLGRAVVSVVCTTLGAMVTTIPLTAIHFGTLSLIAPLSNLLTLWAMTGLFVLGMLVGVLGFVLPGSAAVLAKPVSWLARYVKWSGDLFSSFTFAALSLDSIYYRIWLIFCYIVLVLGFCWKGKRRWIVPACCVLCGLCLSITLTAYNFQRGGMTVTALDVGQGQSILLRCADKLMLVDCGGDTADNAGDIAANYMQSRGESKLDVLVLTHCHDDHANGVIQLLNRVKVGRLFLPETEEDSLLRQEILSLARELDIEISFVRYDTNLSIDETARIVIYPPMLCGKEINELGLSVLASSGEFDVLITGDMSGETEQVLLNYTQLPDVELLVAGHHGSKYSTTQTLLDKITPEICMISVGEHNRYGHPDSDTLARLSGVGAEIYRTDQNGTITITSNQN